jgi:hypothetical protein
MKVTEITVSAGRTFNHPYEQFSNLRPMVTVKATVAEDEDPTKAINELQALAEKSVEDHKQALLHSLEELHYLSEAQRDMTTLAEQITRAQSRLEQIRKQHPQLALPMQEDIPEEDRTHDVL